MTQKQSEKLFKEWLRTGKFTHDGETYDWGMNWMKGTNALIPTDRKMVGPICFLPSELTLTNRDLDEDVHKGFTIGNGKTLYWMMIWHGSGHVTVYPKEPPLRKRWIHGDTIVTVHFK